MVRFVEPEFSKEVLQAANSVRDETGIPPYGLDMAKHMYHYMVSVYSAFFRSTTPLYIDWRVGANRESFGQDEELLATFISLRTETLYFRKDIKN